jgi:hypothetical protein
MEIRKIDDRIKNTPNYVFKRDINYSIDWITILNVHSRAYVGLLIHKSVIYITKYIHICIYTYVYTYVYTLYINFMLSIAQIKDLIKIFNIHI